MSLPSEYTIEDAVRSIDDVVVYRANHPIHGIVNVYIPDDTVPPKLTEVAKKRLYQNGLRMRNVSLLNVPFATKALEVSQNPNEPYIVTKYTKHNLDDLISNGVIVKPKRMFVILSQVLQALINLSENGCMVSRIHPRQIKLSELRSSNITLTVIEGQQQWIDAGKNTETMPGKTPGESLAKITPQTSLEQDDSLTPTVDITRTANAIRTPKEATPNCTIHSGTDSTVTAEKNTNVNSTQQQLIMIQRNIYHLGTIAYQLLFGRKYESGDKLTVANIKKLAGRWQKILTKALGEDTTNNYDVYKSMLQDVTKASNRNRRFAIASIPFLLVLAVIAGYFAYERYHQHKIMTSEAGQAIKSFLEIVNESNDELPELKKPEPSSDKPDEQTILKPFDKIKPIDEE
ncbi:MAG: hypothetical protein ACYSUK_12590 [Planctomycetota bacterium]|jgi:hypothetical protein